MSEEVRSQGGSAILVDSLVMVKKTGGGAE